jgi:enoyl-CoA hydratase
MADPVVIVEKEGPILVVTLNRPEKRNAINSEVMCRLYDAWTQLNDDDDLRVGILTGRGNTFCAGMDLEDLKKLRGDVKQDEWANRVLNTPDLAWKAWLKVSRPKKPIILAVEGHALAGGTEILQGTDIRVAGESARFGVTEVQRGLFPLAGSTVRLRRQMPYAVAAEILLTGDDIPASRAYQLGLINHVVPDGEAMTKAKQIAQRIGDNGPLAVQGILATLRQTEMLPEDKAFEIELSYGMPVLVSEDGKEGAQAFLEKRKPVFKGR